MGLPIFRFTLTHQAPEGAVQFNNNGFDVTISGWSQKIFTDQQPWVWATGGYARADGSLNNYATTGLIGQFRSGGWHPGKYVVDITARNNSGTSGASSPLESSITVRGSQDGISVTTIPDTGNGTWPADNEMRTRRITFELDQYYNYIFFNFIKPGPSTNYDVLIDIDKINIISAPIVKQISEPDGWKDALMKLERHPDFYSLVEYFDGAKSFIFYGNNGVDDGGIDFIKNVERIYGFNADILIKIELSFDGSVYETVFNGQLDLSELQELPDNKLEVPIIQKDFWTTFIARKGTPVNLMSQTDIDGFSITPVASVNLNMTSQKIRKRHESSMTTSVPFGAVGTSEYIQLDWDKVEIDELKEKFTLSRTSNPAIPQAILTAKEGGSYDFDIKLVFTRAQVTGIGEPGDPFIFSWENLHSWLNVYIKQNNGVGLGFTKSDESSGATEWSEFTYQGTFDMSEGDTITIYGDPLNNFTGSAPGSELILIGTDPSDSIGNFWSQTFPIAGLTSYFNISAATTYAQSSAQGYLLHDAFAAVIQSITGRNCFYSEYFGSTTTNARQYDSNGCGWKNVVTKGLQIRTYTLDEKPISWSFNDLWNGANPIFNLCVFYDTIDGEDVIRIEPKEEVFDDSSASHNFDNVRIISREYDTEVIFDKVESGFKKWESEDISGIDDPQGKRVWATIIKKLTNSLQIISDFIAASIAIEVTRRKTIEKAEDYKYDNETFIIAINGDDVSPDRYLPELDENFDSITGLLHEESRYNTIHTPLRMFLRWGNWWNRGLQKYQSSTLQFVSGEANYDMVTDYSCGSGDQCLAIICDSLAENVNLPLGSPSNYGSLLGFLHLPDFYKIEINLSWEDYLLIRSNRELAIGISQTETNHKKLFIKDLSYEICEGKCSLTGWAATEPIELTVLESIQPAPTKGGWNHNFTDEELNCNEIHYRDEFTSDLENWTSEGGTDIPASTLETLSSWDNYGDEHGGPWTIDATPSITLNAIASNANISDYAIGEVTTIPGLTYEFDWQIEIFGNDPTTGSFNFALLDSLGNILDIENVSFSTNGVKSGTVTLSPTGGEGTYFGIQAINSLPGVTAKSFEIQTSTLSGGTGASDAPLPSWAWSSAFGGSAKNQILYGDHGVKNFVLDGVTFPDQDTRIEIKYALPVNNGNNSLKFTIKDSSDVELYSTTFASNVSETSEQTAIIDITSSSILNNADKFEISVVSSNYQYGDTFHINELVLFQCIELDVVVDFDDDYQAILDYAENEEYTLPSSEQQILQNQLLVDLKDAGVWDDLDILYVFATDGDKDFAKINWKNPGTFNATEVNTPSFTENEGFQASTGAYLATGFIPSTDGDNYTLDESGIFCHVNNEPSASGNRAFGCRGDGGVSEEIALTPKSGGSPNHSFALQATAINIGTGVTATGFYHIRRVADNDSRLFKNGVQVGSPVTQESTSLPEVELHLLGYNSNGTPNVGNYELSVFGIGASLTGKESDLYTAWNDYFTAL